MKKVKAFSCVLGISLAITGNVYAFDKSTPMAVNSGDNQQFFKKVTLESGNGGYCSTFFLDKAVNSFGYRKIIHRKEDVTNLCLPDRPCSADRINSNSLYDRYVNIDTNTSEYLETETLVTFNLFKPTLYCNVSAYIDNSNSFKDIITEAIRLKGEGLAAVTVDEFSTYSNIAGDSGGEIISNIAYKTVEGNISDLSVKLQYFSNQDEWVDLNPVSTQRLLISSEIDSASSSIPSGMEKIDHQYSKSTNKWQLPYPTFVRLFVNIKSGSQFDLYSMSVELEECVPDLINASCL